MAHRVRIPVAGRPPPSVPLPEGAFLRAACDPSHPARFHLAFLASFAGTTRSRAFERSTRPRESPGSTAGSRLLAHRERRQRRICLTLLKGGKRCTHE